MNRIHDDGINDPGDSPEFETQSTITAWGIETFGPSPALVIALRMNVEVAELLKELLKSHPSLKDSPLEEMVRVNETMATALNSLQGWVPRGGTEVNPEARTECADVGIMLDQVSYLLGGDLPADKTAKMAVNRKRVWARDANGKMQHLDTFRDPGTGITMSPGLWYIVSDSGSAYTSEGFRTPEAATDWMRQNAEAYGIDLSDVQIPTFRNAREGWAEMSGCNVLLGENVRDFFQLNDPEGWEFMNPRPAARSAA